jgi:hypothetical protein
VAPFDREKFEAHQSAMLLCDRDGRVIDANPRARYLLARTLAEIAALDLEALSAFDERVTEAGLTAYLQRALEAEVDRFAWRVRVSGAAVPTRLQLVRLDDENGEARLLAIVASAETELELADRMGGDEARTGSGVLWVLAGLLVGVRGMRVGAIVGAIAAPFVVVGSVLASGRLDELCATIVILPLSLPAGALTGGVLGFAVTGLFTMLARISAVRIAKARIGD